MQSSLNGNCQNCQLPMLKQSNNQRYCSKCRRMMWKYNKAINDAEREYKFLADDLKRELILLLAKTLECYECQIDLAKTINSHKNKVPPKFHTEFISK